MQPRCLICLQKEISHIKITLPSIAAPQNPMAHSHEKEGYAEDQTATLIANIKNQDVGHLIWIYYIGIEYT